MALRSPKCAELPVRLEHGGSQGSIRIGPVSYPVRAELADQPHRLRQRARGAQVAQSALPMSGPARAPAANQVAGYRARVVYVIAVYRPGGPPVP
jgi:hypothetical protein